MLGLATLAYYLSDRALKTDNPRHIITMRHEF